MKWLEFKGTKGNPLIVRADLIMGFDTHADGDGVERVLLLMINGTNVVLRNSWDEIRQLTTIH